MTIQYKGGLVSGDRDCILDYFAKKTRGIATKTYNFSNPLELSLVMKNKHYREACHHQDQESDVFYGTQMPKVSESSM